MSETPLPNPQEMQDNRVHDINEAHELASRVDKLQTERSLLVGGLALAAESHVDQRSLRDVTDDKEKSFDPGPAHSRGERFYKAAERVAKAEDTIVDVIREVSAEQGMTEESVRELQAYDIGTQGGISEASIQRVAERVSEKVGAIDESIQEVYEGGLNPDEKAAAERADKMSHLVGEIQNRPH